MTERWVPRYYIALVALWGRGPRFTVVLSLHQGFFTQVWHLLRESKDWEPSNRSVLESGVGEVRKV